MTDEVPTDVPADATSVTTSAPVETTVESTPSAPVKKAPPMKKATKKIPAKKSAPTKSVKVAPSKKTPVKKAAAKKAVKPAVKKAPAEPRVKKADTWLPKILKYLSKYPDGKTLAEIKTHFDTTDFGGIFGGNLFPELIQKSRVEGIKGITMILTSKGRKQVAN